MSFKVGYIDSSSYSNIKGFNFFQGSGITDDANVSINESPNGTSFITRNSNKAQINLEIDYYEQDTVADLREVIENRKYVSKAYIHHPAVAAQILDFIGISNPSATDIIKTGVNDSPSVDFGDASMFEISTAEYQRIDNIDSNNDVTTGSAKYAYAFFRFDLTGYKTSIGNDYADYLQRITMFTHNMYAESNLVRDGVKCEVYDETAASWVEIKRINYTISDLDLRTDGLFSQQFWSLRPVQGFSKMSDFVTNDYVTFRFRNIKESATSTTIGYNFAACLVNGFGVSAINADNLNWRSEFTGQGYQGQLVLQEL